MEFIATDVETANSSYSSICQLALVTYREGKIVDTWTSYINPEEEFDDINEMIHGISRKDVEHAPTLPQLYDDLANRASGKTLVYHTPFDRTAYTQALQKYELPPLSCDWLDTSKVVRRAWTEFAGKGYGLKNVSKHLGIDLGQHHDAESDARVAGEILIRALKHTGMTVSECLQRTTRPIFRTPSYGQRNTKEGNPEGPFFGETILFTGTLDVPRSEGWEIAADKGFNVKDRWSKKITVLVVGEQDLRKTKGHKKSSKHRDAERALREGHSIRIIAEDEFYKMMDIE